MIAKAKATTKKKQQKKPSKLDFIKIKIFCVVNTIKKAKNPKEWKKKYLRNHISKNLYLEYIKNSYSSLIKRQTNLNTGKEP